jgi:hypothetical protein
MGPVKFTLIKKLKSNNRFNYTPRYYKGKEDVEVGKFATKLDAYTETYNKNDYGSHWNEARLSRRNRGNVEFNKTVLVIAAILALAFLWFIDFDLTIFS